MDPVYPRDEALFGAAMRAYRGRCRKKGLTHEVPSAEASRQEGSLVRLCSADRELARYRVLERGPAAPVRGSKSS